MLFLRGGSTVFRYYLTIKIHHLHGDTILGMIYCLYSRQGIIDRNILHDGKVEIHRLRLRA